MSFPGPNLAREPFVNLRPVRRAAAILWVASVLLMAWNVAAYLRSGAGVADRAAELERLRRTTSEDRARAATLEADLRRADLARANAQTDFLNRRIAERTFSWNLLLDRLGETLPRGVRVMRLSPEISKDGPARASGVAGDAPPPAARAVKLQIAGEAEDDESLLEFVDRLFAHTAFDRPNLAREARAKSGTINFALTADYQPAQIPWSEGAGVEPGAQVAQGGQTAAGADRPGAAAVRVAPAAGRTPLAAELMGTAPGASAPAASGSAVVRPGRPVAEASVAPPSPRASASAAAPVPGGAAERAAVDAPTARAGAPVGDPALRTGAGGVPRSSIFGGPLLARPYASSGGGR